MDLENIILSELREIQILCDITHVWNLKDTQNRNRCYQRRARREGKQIRSMGLTDTNSYTKIDKQESSVCYRELYPLYCNNL